MSYVCAVTIETDVLPFIGSKLIPDDLVRRLGQSLQSASRLYDLDLSDADDTASLSDNARDSANSSVKETRFDHDFDRQALGSDMHGTTAEIVERPRERYAYWCLDLLFLMCAANADREFESLLILKRRS